MKKTLLLYLLWFSIFLCLTGLALIAFGGDWRIWGLGGLVGGILGALIYTVLNYGEVHHFLFEYGTRQWLNLAFFVMLLFRIVVGTKIRRNQL